MPTKYNELTYMINNNGLAPEEALQIAVFSNAVRDAVYRKNKRLDYKLDAILWLLSDDAGDILESCNCNRDTALNFILRTASARRLAKQGDVLNLFRGLTTYQVKEFRKLILEALPKLREQAIAKHPRK